MQPWARLLMYYMKNGCTVTLNISLQFYFYSAKLKQQLLQALKIYNNWTKFASKILIKQKKEA